MALPPEGELQKFLDKIGISKADLRAARRNYSELDLSQPFTWIPEDDTEDVMNHPRPLRIEVRPPPPNPNKMLRKGLTVGVQTGIRKRILKEVGYQLIGQATDPESVVTIHCHLIRAGRREWDEGNIGAGGSLKWVVDALVKLGAIKEDSPKWVRYTTPTQEYKKPKSIYFKGALIVTLEWKENRP